MNPTIHLPRQIADDHRLRGLPREFLLVLSSQEDGQRNRWVRLKQKEFGELLGVTRESVHRTAKRLAAMGYLETRNVTTRARGRTSLEYRIKHDLPDNIVENADVIQGSLNQADVITKSHESVADVIAESPKTMPDVIEASLPIRDSTTYNLELYPERLSLVPTLVANAGDAPAPTSGAALSSDQAIELYNEAAKRAGWCLARGEASPARKHAVCARLREHGMEGWAANLAFAETMPFLAGESNSGWRMGLDYFASARGWQKIYEGSFQTRANLRTVNDGGFDSHDGHRNQTGFNGDRRGGGRQARSSVDIILAAGHSRAMGSG